MDAIRAGPRVRAPEFVRGDWFNSAPLTLHDLRGRFVLLDFWTSCCGNCLHVLDELRPFEAEHGDVVTVVGIHSPKFPHEAQPEAVAAAIGRYEITHPVLNDRRLALWNQYAVRAWPTLVLVDPQGYVVAQAAGEGQVSALAALLETLVVEHERRGTLRRGTEPVPQPDRTRTTLRYPAKAIPVPAAVTGQVTGRDADSVLVADAGHHQIVELAADLRTVLRRIGTGERGEPFAEPNGLALLPAGLVPYGRAPYDVLVADTANHMLRGVRLADGDVAATIDLPAALAAARTVTGAVPPVLSPWDVAWWPALHRVVIAAAGVHLLLAYDLASGVVEVLAGTTVEGLRDGPALDAWLAQPSGLAVDGDRLWFVDSETSALRSLRRDGTGLTVTTHVGAGLFDFGHVDGPAAGARMQHPLGVTLLPDRSVAVFDTYNGAVRRYDPASDTVQTVADGLAEPSGGFVSGADLVVVESLAHRLVRIATTAAHEVAEAPQRAERAPTDLGTGRVTLRVEFSAPPGRKLDDRFGPSTSLAVSATPAALLRAGGGSGPDLERVLELAEGGGVLQVTARAASCDDTGAAHPACYLARQDWGVPVRVGSGGASELRLMLLG